MRPAGPLTSRTIDNVNLRLRRDTGKVTMSSYLMRADQRPAGIRRSHRLQHCVTGGSGVLIFVRRDLTGDDERNPGPVSLNFVLLSADPRSLPSPLLPRRRLPRFRPSVMLSLAVSRDTVAVDPPRFRREIVRISDNSRFRSPRDCDINPPCAVTFFGTCGAI